MCALLRWVEGGPLDELKGVLSIHSEDLGETSTEDMLLRWLLGLTEGLAALHTQGLVHGDVSPRNILVQFTDRGLDRVQSTNRFQRLFDAVWLSNQAGRGVGVKLVPEAISFQRPRLRAAAA